MWESVAWHAFLLRIDGFLLMISLSLQIAGLNHMWVSAVAENNTSLRPLLIAGNVECCESVLVIKTSDCH